LFGEWLKEGANGWSICRHLCKDTADDLLLPRLLDAKCVQKPFCYLRVIQVPGYTVTIVGRILNFRIICDLWSNRKIRSVKRVQGHNIARIKCVKPSFDRQRISQGPKLIADRSYSKRTAHRQIERNAETSAV